MQFPDPFPKFIPDPARSFLRDVELDDLKPKEESASMATGEAAEKKTGLTEEEKEEKQKLMRIRALQRKEAARKAEGRIGTLVVMKSGKVKMVLGDGIVLDVSREWPWLCLSVSYRVVTYIYTNRSLLPCLQPLCSRLSTWTSPNEMPPCWVKLTRALS